MVNMVKLYAIIPARGGSKGIPRKNLATIHGKTLVEIAIDKALSAPGICNVFVSTEDVEIISVALDAGARVIPRPAALARDDTPTLPVIAHALDWLQVNGAGEPDGVLTLYPTAATLPRARIAEAVEVFSWGVCDSVVSVVQDFGHFWTRGGRRIYPQTPKNRQIATPCYRENGGVYLTAPALIRAGEMVGGIVGFVVMAPGEMIDIDTPDDLQRAREAL